MSKEKIKLIKDGRPRGWVFSAGITIFDYMTIFLASIGFEPALTMWKDIGDQVRELSIWLILIWFVSKRVQDFVPIVQALIEGYIKKKVGGE